MNNDDRETLRNLSRPAGISVLSERLGLSGDTDEVMALCSSIERLLASRHIEFDPTPGFLTFRWRITPLGKAARDADL